MSFNRKTGYYNGYIYRITNKINNRKYIGQTTVDCKTRWHQHIKSSEDEKPELIIGKAIKKYGGGKFHF